MIRIYLLDGLQLFKKTLTYLLTIDRSIDRSVRMVIDPSRNVKVPSETAKDT